MAKQTNTRPQKDISQLLRKKEKADPDKWAELRKNVLRVPINPRAKIKDIKDLKGSFLLVGVYCFLCDVAEKLLVCACPDPNEPIELRFDNLYSPHLQEHPQLLEKAGVDEGMGRDWRDEGIPILNDLKIIKCKGVGVQDDPMYPRFHGIELTVVNKAKFFEFLKKVKALYESGSVSTPKKKTKVVSIPKKKSKKLRYETTDVLTFIERDERKAGHIVKINKGKEFCILYASSGFLLLLAKTLKSDNKGWIGKEIVKDDGLIVPGPGNDQQRLMVLVNKLRANLKGKVSNVYSFIEKGRGQYRLSTDPSNIQGKDSKWLRHEYEVVLKELKAGRKKDSSRQENDLKPKKKITLPPIPRDLK